MAVIKIPGKISLDNKTDDEEEISSISEDLDDDEVDPLDKPDNTSLDFNDDKEPNEHADINIDDIAGDENGYDTALQRITQELTLAEHDAANGLIDESLTHRIRITALSKIAYSKNHWIIGKYEVQLAHSYLDLKGSDFATQCEQHAQEGLKIMLRYVENMFNEEEKMDFLQTLISAHFALSRSQIILKNVADSEINIEKAFSNLKKLETLCSITEDEVLSVRLKLMLAAGKISFRLNKLIVASNFFHEAATMIQNIKGENNAELIPIYQFLGKIEQSNGNLSNHSKAIEFYLSAHNIANKIYETHNAKIVQTGRAVATAYSIVGTVDSEKSAESYLKQCLESLVIVNGDDHPTVCDIQSELARLLIRSDRKTGALSKLMTNLKTEKKVFGEYSEEVLETYKLLGSLHLSNTNIDEAYKFYQKALLIEELQNGPQSKLSRSLKSTISRIKLNPEITIPAKELQSRPRFSSTFRPK